MRVLKDRQALVTGAAGGIGRAIAVALARRGMHLWLVDRDSRRLVEVAREVRELGVEVRPLTADLACREEVDAVARTVLDSDCGVDVLVNNAGIAHYGGLHKMSDDQWDRLMAVNLEAPIRLTRRLLVHMRSRPEAHVVNMCSIAGIVAGGRFTGYHTSKFGLLGFTLALRAEYTRKGLGVSAICPGACRTNLYRDCTTTEGAGTHEPPAWLAATPEKVAEATVRAILRNKRQVIITPTAHLLYQLHRFVPGVLDFIQTVSRRQLPWYKGKPLHIPSIIPGERRHEVVEDEPVTLLHPAALRQQATLDAERRAG
jgi:short-subunit dehydrogenase